MQPRRQHNQDYPRELLASAYHEVGAITVDGEPRLHVYRLGGAGSPLGVHERIYGWRPYTIRSPG